MQEFLVILIQCSISMSLVTLVYAAIMPILSKRYTARWNYIVWLLIAIGWIFPFWLWIDLPFLQIFDKSIAFVHSTINVIPVYVGGAINKQETAFLWWLFAGVWGLGVVSTLLYHILRHYRFVKFVDRWSEPLTDTRALEILNRLKTELGIKKHIRLSTCKGVTYPMLVGFFRPAILLPPIKSSVDIFSMILKHELIHFKRHDLWYKAVIVVATAFHWFNPVVYIMAKAVVEQCEISCDALVVKNVDFQQRIKYGEAIIKFIRNGKNSRTTLANNFYGGKTSMKNRLSSIVDLSQKKNGAFILCMTLVGMLISGGALTAVANSNVTEVVAGPHNSVIDDHEVSRLKEALSDLSVDKADGEAQMSDTFVTWSYYNDGDVEEDDSEVAHFKKLLQQLYNNKKLK
ncbi:M56 family metallopeptidase [Alkalihalobacillus oceani]|uniref:M56 family metallopeptidase n=1 Tax=Halalkalibacter oceani TaxID=1653776 RepID=UPI0020411C56|nr:M56 family metallopeptidase [Halalkalibacter oceani]MCM3762675.1 M56 family metallopeptidase [Halalkalibacter oceani]